MPAVDGPRDELRRDGGFPEAGWRDEEHTPRTSERRPDLADRARLVRAKMHHGRTRRAAVKAWRCSHARHGALLCGASRSQHALRDVDDASPRTPLAARAGAGKADDGGEAEERHRNHPRRWWS